MRIKRVLRPERLRRIPRQFSWIDQRLVSEHYLERCDAGSLALYLFLVTVADAQGLSYYGEAKLTKILSMPATRLEQARPAALSEVRSDGAKNPITHLRWSVKRYNEKPG
jgi:hypothetical protein